jgi:uncharacterized LabA/DUF88 family protein
VTRVKVFIDYQNVYHGARGAFGQKDDHPNVGHVRPWGLGVLLRQLGEAVDPARTLEQVAIYRGEPTTRSHPLLQAAFQKQVAAWSSLAPKLDVTTRPLRYNATRWDHSGKPIEWDKGEEKGIDVLLALGLVLGAIRDEYDVAVVVSGDTDLVPAIDATLDVGKRVENAVWQPDHEHARPLRATGSRRIWCHRLTRKHFEWVSDPTDYAHLPANPSSL